MEDFMIEKEKERNARWQDYRITQFSFSINLFLTFAVAALGFCLTLIKDSSFVPSRGAGHILYCSMMSLAGSIIFGTLATLSRLLDFRCTTIKITKKYSDWRLGIAKFLAKWLGGVSWSLFYLQLAALAYGGFSLICTIVIAYSDKFAK
jgi:hypothetical protein